MAKLPRVTAKIFASNANPDDIGQYGSALAGDKVTTGNIAEIQALPAYEVGWRGAVLSTRNFPSLQEMNGLQKTFSQQIAYILNNGVAEYDSATSYNKGDIIKVLDNSGVPTLKYSLTDNNLGNNPSNAAYWKVVNLVDISNLANIDLSNLSTSGQAKLNAKANDNAVVHKTGAETITGVKTFTTNQIPIKIQSPNIDLAVTPSSNLHNFFDFVDKNGVRVGAIGSLQNSSGTYGTYLQAGNFGGFGILSDGTTAYAIAPTPSNAADNSIKIATTEWVNGFSANKSLNNLNSTGEARFTAKANDNAVVHKTGAETITGEKTLNTSSSTALVVKSSSINISATTSSNKYSYIDFTDKNNSRVGVIGAGQNTNGTYGIYLQPENKSGIAVLYNGTTSYATAPASAVTNSIVTTAGINKAANGYVKLGNGIIIQWGSFVSGVLNGLSGKTTTITFPTAFTSTNYQITAITSTGQNFASTQLGYISKTTTTAQLSHWNPDEAATASLSVNWIAVGY